MSRGVITSTHVQKLGHNLREIRERALDSVVSKLEHGFLYDDDLARSKEILSKLFEWFSFDLPQRQETVLRLMLRILKSESGIVLIKHYGSQTIQSEIQRIRPNVEPAHHVLLNEILFFMTDFIIDESLAPNNDEIRPMVPPLQSDLPLSYRTQDSSGRSVFPKSTAEPIEGYIIQDPSTEDRVTPTAHSKQQRCSSEVTTCKSGLSVHFNLRWETLDRSDVNVIKKVEENLRNPCEPVALLNLCEFFRDIMLQDYPAEVFLQRPSIVQLLYEYLRSSSSTRLSNDIFKCLLRLTECLIVRIKSCEDPCMHSSKRNEYIIPPSSNDSSSTSTERSYMQNLDLRDFYVNYADDNLDILKNNQLSIPRFCFLTIDCIFNYIYYKPALRDPGKRRRNLFAINSALFLFDRLLLLLSNCLKPNYWQLANATSDEVLGLTLKEFEQIIFIKFAAVLEHFRVEVVSDGGDSNAATNRLIHIHLLASCSDILVKFVPVDRADLVLSRVFQNALANSLLDSVFVRLYPEVHTLILSYVEKLSGHFETSDSMVKFKEVASVCESMTAAVKLLKEAKILSVAEAVKLSCRSVASLEFHRNFRLLAIIVEVFTDRLPLCGLDSRLFDTAQETILSLLANGDDSIKEETYKLCHARVVGAVGTRSNLTEFGRPGSQIIFLLKSAILIEICTHGLINENKQIQKYSDEILIHILKCKILVSDEIWNRVVEATLPSLPLLTCHANKNGTLGRTIVDLLDPDKATDLKLPTLEVLKANLRLLFVKDNLTRSEALSRLCWMLTSQENSRNLLPRLNTLQDKDLSSICQFARGGGGDNMAGLVSDLNRTRHKQHFYQPSSLAQVLDLLGSKGVEPVIRRSALNQVSVMVEDSLLHRTFAEHGGVKLITDIMKSALVENDYDDYVDCVISAISVLRTVCLHSSAMRQQLCNDMNIFFYLLRGLFIFCSEERVRQDCGVLLCLLTFSEHVWGTPVKGDLSLPALLIDSLALPFTCKVHWQTSRHTPAAFAVTLLCDKWCTSSIQIHWNSEWFGGFDKILKWKEVNYSDSNLSEFDHKLCLNESDLFMLKNSSLDYCLTKCLAKIQNGTCHSNVMETICKVKGYLNLYAVLTKNTADKDENDCRPRATNFQWEYTFSRFLKVPPANEEDALLLINCVQLLIALLPLYEWSKARSCWIVLMLKDRMHCLPNLLQTSEPCNEFTVLRKELLNLIIAGIRYEQKFFHVHLHKYNSIENTNGNWKHLIEILADNLRLQRGEPTHNLSYLDSTLACLVHLTSVLGWSGGKSGSVPREPIPALILNLCELVQTFYGYRNGIRGDVTAVSSRMGVSITRHVFLVLNHLVAELQFCGSKNWEMCFIGEDVVDRYLLDGIEILLLSPDVVLRAAVWQLLGSLSISPRCAVELVQVIKELNSNKSLWELALSSLLDHSEASVVRENVANLLTNLASHTGHLSSDLICTIIPVSLKKNGSSSFVSLLNLLEDFKFFKELEPILTCLHLRIFSRDNLMKMNFYNETSPPDKSKSLTHKVSLCMCKDHLSLKNDTTHCSSVWTAANNTVVTPGFLRSLSFFVHNLLVLSHEDVIMGLQEHSLIKLFFRCLSSPPAQIDTIQDLSLYCEILEMNTAVCMLLSRAIRYDLACLGTVLQTRDCLNVMLSLLDPVLYFTDMPQLIYLRNRLWTELFDLIGALLSSSQEDDIDINMHRDNAHSIITIALSECGHQAFLQTLCEAIDSDSSEDLQLSALTSLTSLLRVEAQTFSIKVINLPKECDHSNTSSSIQSILDSFRTPRLSMMKTPTNTPRDPKTGLDSTNNPTVKISPREKLDMLRDVYFGSGDSDNRHYISKCIPYVDKIASKLCSKDCDDSLMAGAELCRILIHLYEISNVESKPCKKRAIILKTLTSLLCVSREAKKFALQGGLIETTIDQLKDLHVKLSLESVENLRRANEKRRVSGLLKELDHLVGMSTNFMAGDEAVKGAFSMLGFSDLVHKLWVWFGIERVILTNALRMLCTFTTSCSLACQSICMTSPLMGSGPRKTPGSLSLLHEIVTLVCREMEMISRMHDLTVLELCFHVLHNSCEAVECRSAIIKSTLLNCLPRLHPAMTKRQKPWEHIELLWLDFLSTITTYPEGQVHVAKNNDAFDLLLMLANSARPSNRYEAILVLRNLAFHQQNRPRLVNSRDFLNVLNAKLSQQASIEEQDAAATMIWALCANNQRTKLVLKSAGIDASLYDCLKRLSVLPSERIPKPEIVERIYYVYGILKDSDRGK